MPHNNAGNASEVPSRFRCGQTRCFSHGHHGFGLAEAHFERECAAGLQQTGQRCGYDAGRREAVGAAVQRRTWFEFRDLRGEVVDVRRWYVGRIRDNEIETLVETLGPMALP